MSQSRTWRRDWPLEAVLTVLAIVTYIPFVLTIINSFKENPQFFKEFWLPVLPLYPENYAISLPRMGRAIFASFCYSIPTLVLTLVISGPGMAHPLTSLAPGSPPSPVAKPWQR